MNLAGLAPDKSPPIEAPLGLFYLMPVFLGLAGLALAWQGDQVLSSRWNPAALAATHFVVLGALAPVMCGALLQIAPVLLGAPYSRPGLTAGVTVGCLGFGSLLVGSGFLFDGRGLLLGGGLVAGTGLLVFLAASLHALAGAAGRSPTLWTVRLAVLALAVTVGMGLTLVAARFGLLAVPDYPLWVDTHATWGLAGWLGLLLAGIGMEIIPLFYVAPAFNSWTKRLLSLGVFGLLLMAGLGLLLQAPSWLRIAVGALFLVHLSFNIGAMWHEQRRLRQRRDASLWLWQLGHVAVYAAFLVWLLGDAQSVVGVLLLGGALSFVIGSLVKIVPFLSWLDLQQRRLAGGHSQVALPRLRDLLPDGLAYAIAISLTAALVAVSMGAVLPLSAHLGGGFLIACAALLAHALFGAARLRQSVIRRLDGAAGNTG